MTIKILLIDIIQQKNIHLTGVEKLEQILAVILQNPNSML